MDDTWVRERAERIKSELAAKKAQEERYARDQELKKVLGPILWEELKTWLKESCESLNKQMDTEVAEFKIQQ